MRALVCGGRNFNNKKCIYHYLDGIEITHLIHGGCPTGVDFIAHKYALENNIQTSVFIANWKKYGKAAGPIRNQQMIDEGKPEIIIAFPGGKGTLNMCRLGSRANLRLILIDPGILGIELLRGVNTLT